MRNNNQAVIYKLTNRSLKANPKRNVILVVAILLTTFMLTSVFSVAMSMLETARVQFIRMQGSESHVAFGFPTREQLDRLNELNYVRSYGVGSYIGFIHHDEADTPGQMRLSLAFLDENLIYQIRLPAWMDFVGSYPAAGEVLVSRFGLEQLGITNPRIGMEIPLSFSLVNEETIRERTFILSGFYTGFNQFHQQEILFTVSAEMAEYYGVSVEDYGSVNVLFNNSRQVPRLAERLAEDLGLLPEQGMMIHPVFDLDLEELMSGILVLLLIVLFIMFSGYLLIYNILHISVSRDVRFYGLLKTVGTTKKQIRRMIYLQTMKLSIRGIPLGLLSGFLVSFVLVPRMFQVSVGDGAGAGTFLSPELSFSPIIYLGATAFALLTALIGAIAPARKIAKISPIEAEKYVGEVKIKDYKGARTGGKVHKMALRNLFRDRKRAQVVLFSLFLGVTVFVSISVIVFSLDVNRVLTELESDFVIDHRGSGYPPLPLPTSFIEEIALLPHVDTVRKVSQGTVMIDYQPGLDARLDGWVKQFAEWGVLVEREDFIERGFHGYVFGVDATFLDNQSIFPVSTSFGDGEDGFDIAAFERGEFGLIITNQPELFKEISALDLSFYQLAETGEFIIWEELSLPIGGTVAAHPHGRWAIEFGFLNLIVSSTLTAEIYGVETISTVLIDVVTGYDEQLLEQLREIIREYPTISMRSRFEEVRDFEEGRRMLLILGLSISLILGGIGVLNFVNSMSMGMVVRKREFATLESIGMTGTQLCKMLIGEGLWYGLITLGLVGTIGHVFAFGLYRLAIRGWDDLMTFTYPFLTVSAVSLIILVMCVLVPWLFYRSLSKMTVVDRLREIE